MLRYFTAPIPGLARKGFGTSPKKLFEFVGSGVREPRTLLQRSYHKCSRAKKVHCLSAVWRWRGLGRRASAFLAHPGAVRAAVFFPVVFRGFAPTRIRRLA